MTTTTTTKKTDSAQQDARAWLSEIRRQIVALDEEGESPNEALNRIHESVLELLIRSRWHAPGGNADSAEFALMLTIGGPTVRITGKLCDGEPAHGARLEYAAPWEPWQSLPLTAAESDAVLAWARCFYFGE